MLGFDAADKDAIISKETDCPTDGFVGEVVDVGYISRIVWGQEQYLGAHRRGQDGRRIASLQKQLSAISLAKFFESRHVWFL